MNLTILYGPPGVGKYTVATRLAERTGATVFHNHIMLDAIEPIVGRAYAGFGPMIYSLQRTVLRHAMQADLHDVIFTFAFTIDLPEDVDMIRGILQDAHQIGADVRLVYLTCALDDLKHRVAQPERTAFRKLKNPEVVESLWHTYDLSTPLADVPQLSLDTTGLSIDDVVDRINASWT